jgi:hypothetical protein
MWQQAMEKNVERRIRYVKVMPNGRLWITLFQAFSKLDTHIYRCINSWIATIKKTHGVELVLHKIDLKNDYYGSYYWET